MTTTINAEEASQQWSKLLEMAKAGTEVIIAEGNTPVARLTAIAPPLPPRQPRVLGLHQGAAWVSEDFDEPLPEEFWLGGACESSSTPTSSFGGTTLQTSSRHG